MYRAIVYSLLGIAAVLRLILVLRGGQFFFPDESRYQAARDAVQSLLNGQWRGALTIPLQGGDHVGFKFLAMVPALVERWTQPGPVVPALVLAGMSVLTLALLVGIAGRMGATPAARLWVLLAGVTSSTLFYPARHLLPYDLSMALALLGAYVALGGRPDSRGRCWLAGVLAGAAFLVYFGYWLLAGVALLIGGLYPIRHLAEAWRRLLWIFLGGVSTLAVPLVVDRLWGGGRLVSDIRVFSGSITQGADFRGHFTPWEFLLRVEALWLLVAAGGAALIIRATSRARSERQPVWQREGVMALAGVVAVALGFVVFATVLEQFVIYGRIARQLAPFLVLVIGFGLGHRVRGRSAIGLAALLLLNGIWTMGPALTLQFPAAFHARWAPAVEAANRDGSGLTYQRFVNVTRYIFEAEELEAEPRRTIAAEPHPYSYLPYLYEGFSPAERARRWRMDHRMRVVEMSVPEAEQIQGEQHGIVRFKVRFASGRGGFADPLLSVGPPEQGDVFFVRHLTDTRVQFGVESMQHDVLLGAPVDLEPGRVYELECFSGSLLSASGGGAEAEAARSQLWMRLDDHVVLDRTAPAHRAEPTQVYVGANVAGAPSAGTRFPGAITDVVRGGLPPPPAGFGRAQSGPVQIRLRLPGHAANRPEPLLVVGTPGEAVLGYVMMVEPGLARFGVEVWGLGAWEGEPVRVALDREHDVEFSFGSLYPPIGSPDWGAIGDEQQRRLKRAVEIKVNGRRVFRREVATPEFSASTLSLSVGRNPVGGSHVLEAFSGIILRWGQGFPD